MNCVEDKTTDLKAKFARLRCKSLKRRNSPRFNTASFLLEGETMEYNYLLPRKKERKRREEKVCVFLCIFQNCKKALFIIA